jgi:pimeloyl-ACP methyl ester carboxylesterase
MSRIETQEFSIGVPGGNVYARGWMPDTLLTDIPVVLMHDSLGCVDLWRDFPERLARDLASPVYAYDRLGFGRSDGRSGPPSLEFIAEEAALYFPLVKAGLSISSYILFGHSVGGGMAITIASRDPDCKGVVTVAAQAFVEDRTREGIVAAKEEFDRPGQFERLERWHGKKAKWVLDAWTGTWLSPAFADWSLGDSIGNVRCPVLAIHGALDEYGSTAFAEFIAGRSGGASELLILEDCGHMPHREKPDVVIQAVREFWGTGTFGKES